MGWGLRNSVGVAEEPLTGGIYSVENSADNIERDGTDIHQNNPGEEMNFHGFLNSSTENQGGNYGYPLCFAMWNTSEVPDVRTLTTGSQFAQDQNSTINDTSCAEDYVAPRLTFQAHMAPLDLKFFSNGTAAFVTFHGSWYVCNLNCSGSSIDRILGIVQHQSATKFPRWGLPMGLPLLPLTA